MRPEGTVFGIRSNDTAMLNRIRTEILDPHWKVEPFSFHVLFSLFVGGEKRPGFRNFSLLYDGTRRLARSHDVEEVFEALRRELPRRVAQLACYRCYVRGAIVCPGVLLLGEDAYAGLDGEGHLEGQPWRQMLVYGTENRPLSQAESVWHLFSHLETRPAARESLQKLVDAVRNSEVRARMVRGKLTSSALT